MEDKIFIHKNILDNHFQKQLQIVSGSIIVVFTYIIGSVIAIMSNQINWRDYKILIFVTIFSFFVLGLAGFFFIRSSRKLKRISAAIENLENLV